MKKQIKLLESIFFALFLLFLASCKPSQKIVYNTDSIKQYHESSGVTISIQSFEDIRSESEVNQAQLFAKDVISSVNKKTTCINAEKLYKTPIGLQMSDIFAKHLDKKGFFSTVLLNQKERTDYYVTAKIRHFYGMQDYSSSKAVGANFGLIGALATAGIKTKGEIIIELSDICLYDKTDNLIAKVGDFRKEYTGEFPVDAYCYCIYQNINNKLIEFNEELGKMLFMEVKNTKTTAIF